MSCTEAWAELTYGATGVGAAMKERARHPDDLGLHLPHTGEDVRVKRVAPCEVSVNLETVGKICTSSKYLQKLRHSLKGRTQEVHINERCGGETVFTAANAKQVYPLDNNPVQSLQYAFQIQGLRAKCGPASHFVWPSESFEGA